MNSLLRIEQTLRKGHGLPTRDVRLITQDGTEIGGVISLTLKPRQGNVWRAVIECHIQAPDIR